jgi:N-acetylmuramoyl-L-alanine amidase CwlA
MATTKGRKSNASSVRRSWAGGFDGKGYDINTLRARLEKMPSPAWVQRIVIHNTATPDMKRTAQIGPSRYVKNVASYYRDTLGWSSGPHYFVADSQPDVLIFEGTPLTSRGTHSPSWNGNSIGIEMCANFIPGVDDDDSGGGLRIKETTCKLAAALLYKLGLSVDNDTVKLHKEDPKTTHDCPGRDIEKPDILALISRYLADMAPAGEHVPGQIPVDTKTAKLTSPSKSGEVKTERLNLRAGSGMAQPVVAVLAKGTKVEILNSAETAVSTWLRVKAPSVKKKGWLSGRYVDVDGKPAP